jgi:hypothetical protein
MPAFNCHSLFVKRSYLVIVWGTMLSGRKVVRSFTRKYWLFSPQKLVHKSMFADGIQANQPTQVRASNPLRFLQACEISQHRFMESLCLCMLHCKFTCDSVLAIKNGFSWYLYSQMSPISDRSHTRKVSSQQHVDHSDTTVCKGFTPPVSGGTLADPCATRISATPVINKRGMTKQVIAQNALNFQNIQGVHFRS